MTSRRSHNRYNDSSRTQTRARHCSSIAGGSWSRRWASSLTFDATAFATLTAADFSANDQLAKLVGETDFSTLFHQGEKESIYLADVARRLILVVLFDNRTTLGLVRLRMKQAVQELTLLFDGVFSRGGDGTPVRSRTFCTARRMMRSTDSSTGKVECR